MRVEVRPGHRPGGRSSWSNLHTIEINIHEIFNDKGEIFDGVGQVVAGRGAVADRWLLLSQGHSPFGVGAEVCARMVLRRSEGVHDFPVAPTSSRTSFPSGSMTAVLRLWTISF